MLKSIDLTNKKILETGALPKTGGTYHMFLQGVDNLDDIMQLQDAAFKDLTEEEKTFLLYKDPNFFRSHFDMNNLVLGVVHNGVLIAQSIIVNPDVAHPKTGMVDMVLPATPEKLTILQGVIVHPDYRGNMLMTKMIDVWLELSSTTGRTHALAEVTVENHYSWNAFLKEGLPIHSIGHDPDDGAILYNISAEIDPLIKKRLSPDFNKAAVKADDIVLEAKHLDIEEQKNIIKQGYEGIAFDAKKAVVTFKKKPTL